VLLWGCLACQDLRAAGGAWRSPHGGLAAAGMVRAVARLLAAALLAHQGGRGPPQLRIRDAVHQRLIACRCAAAAECWRPGRVAAAICLAPWEVPSSVPSCRTLPWLSSLVLRRGVVRRRSCRSAYAQHNLGASASAASASLQLVPGLCLDTLRVPQHHGVLAATQRAAEAGGPGFRSAVVRGTDAQPRTLGCWSSPHKCSRRPQGGQLLTSTDRVRKFIKRLIKFMEPLINFMDDFINFGFCILHRKNEAGPIYGRLLKFVERLIKFMEPIINFIKPAERENKNGFRMGLQLAAPAGDTRSRGPRGCSSCHARSLCRPRAQRP